MDFVGKESRFETAKIDVVDSAKSTAKIFDVFTIVSFEVDFFSSAIGTDQRFTDDCF